MGFFDTFLTSDYEHGHDDGCEEGTAAQRSEEIPPNAYLIERFKEIGRFVKKLHFRGA